MKLLVVDDHALIREGLRAILRGSDPDLVFIEACDGQGAHQRLADHPDVDMALLDVRMPDCDGIELMRELQARCPALPVVMLSAECDAATVRRAIDNGASGFLSKSSLNQVLVSALNLVMAGGIYIPPEVMRRQPEQVEPAHVAVAPLASNHPNRSPGLAPFGAPAIATEPGASAAALGLTDRQTDVLVRLLEGKSNKQICRELDLAEATVKVHVRAILRVLGVNSRTEAMVAAARLGFGIAAGQILPAAE